VFTLVYSLKNSGPSIVTDVIQRSGILRSSPLVLTLASVRFTPWQLLSKEIGEIHNSLRDVTPLFHGLHIQATFPGLPSAVSNDLTPTSWLFLSEDKTKAIQISNDQILFYSRTYKRYGDFEAFLRRGLEALLSRMNFMHVTSLGVRYVDHIRPRKGESPDQYVASELLTPSLGELGTVGGIAVYTYRAAADSELRVRSVCNPQLPAVPEDLVPTVAIINHLVQGPAQDSTVLPIQLLKQGEVLLDFDAVKTNVGSARIDSADALLQQLNGLHSIANNFFRHKQVCKDFAFNVWQEESAT
jgi:uncharacterized protein (TIGR04255 family)